MNTNLLAVLKEYWVVLAFGASLIVTWTQFDARIKANSDAITVIQTQLNQQTATVVQMQTDIAYIKANLDFIKNYITNE